MVNGTREWHAVGLRFFSNRIEFVQVVDRGFGAFGQRIAQQAAGAFADAALPGTVRVVSKPEEFDISAMRPSRGILYLRVVSIGGYT